MNITPEIESLIKDAHKRAKVRRLHCEFFGDEFYRRHEEKPGYIGFMCSPILKSLIIDETTTFLEGGNPNIYDTIRKIFANHFGLPVEVLDEKIFKNVIKKDREDKSKKLLKSHLKNSELIDLDSL